MTINSLHIIKTILESNGYYHEDPQAFAVSSYINDWKTRTYHIAYSFEDWVEFHISPFCHDIQTLWTQAQGLTAERKALLEG